MLSYLTDPKFLAGLAAGYLVLGRLLSWLFGMLRPA